MTDTAADGSNAVEVRGLSKVFNAGRPDAVEALVDIDLEIAPGAFVSLIGPSGCGKSTQLRLIANLTEPTTGQVLVNGKPARDELCFCGSWTGKPIPNHYGPTNSTNRTPTGMDSKTPDFSSISGFPASFRRLADILRSSRDRMTP